MLEGKDFSRNGSREWKRLEGIESEVTKMKDYKNAIWNLTTL